MTLRTLLAVLCLGLLSAVSVAQEKAEESALRPNTLVVVKIKLQTQDTVYAEPGQAMVVVSTDEKNVVIKLPDGKEHLRVALTAVVPIKEAAPLYDQLIRAAPGDATLLLARSNVWNARGEAAKAMQDIQKAIQINPKYQAAHVSLVEALVDQKRYDAALKIVTEALQLDPKNPTYYVLRGVAYRHKQEFEEAITAFTKALSLDSKNIPALSSRGFIHYLKKDHALAVKDFDAWVQLAPDNAMAVNNRGYNRQFNGDFAGALTDYNAALQLSPKFALAYQNKAWLLATCPDDKIRDGGAAFAAASKACVMRNYKVPEDLKALAASYAELADFQHAIEFQQRVVEMKTGTQKEAEQHLLKTYQANRPFRTTITR